MSLEFSDKEELVMRLMGLKTSIDGDLRLVGTILERIGRAKKEVEVIEEELNKRDV